MLFALPDFGVLAVNGPDATQLLQGQLTCDVAKLNHKMSCMGAHCNQQGRIISLFYLFKWHDDYYLVLPKTLISIAISALKKYAVFYKVSIKDVSDTFYIAGGNAASTPDANVHLLTLPANHLHIELHTNPIDASDFSATWYAQLLESGIVTVYPETSGQFLPHELNLPALGAVSFDKGCYTGQEIIARMHYRGKMKKALLVATAEGAAPLRGSEVFADVDRRHAMGCVVDAVQVAEDEAAVLLLLDGVHVEGVCYSVSGGRIWVKT